MNMMPSPRQWTITVEAAHGGGAPHRPPLFSVIVPLFNKQETVRRTLASVVAQDLVDFEVIVVDDGSTDDSAAHAATIDDPRIRRLSQPNAGPAAARNQAAAAATGDWLAFIDADDIWMPDHLSTLARLIEASPSADVACTTSRQRREADLPPIGRSRSPAAVAKIAMVDYLVCAHRLSLQTSCVAVRRAAFDAAGGFGPYCPGEDTEMWARLALAGPFAVSSADTSIYVRGTWGIMERIERTAARPAMPGASPIQATLRRCLHDPSYRHRHASIRACLDRLHRRDARIALVRGHRDVARAQLNAAATTSLSAIAYHALALLPPTMLAAGLRRYARARYRLRAGVAGLLHRITADAIRPADPAVVRGPERPDTASAPDGRPFMAMPLA